MILNSKKEKFIYFVFPTILFSIIPLFLITGPFLSDFSISLIGVLFLAYCFKHKNFSYFNQWYFHLFIIFWIYLIINSLINNFNIDSLKISVFFIRYGIFVIAIVTYLDFEHRFLNYFFYCIFFCFIILIFDGFYQYFYGENFLGWKNSERTSSLFGKEKILGSYLSRLWPVFFGLSILLVKKKTIFFYLLVAIFILSEVLIFLSGDRTAFFYINFSAIFVIIFSRKLFKLRVILLFSSIILITIISFFNQTAKERVFDQTINQLRANSNDETSKDINFDYDSNIYIFSKEHTYHYLSAYKMFLDNKAFGVGVKNFRNFCKKEEYKLTSFSCSSHPHNTYVQILTETGVIGFLFLIYALIYFCYKILKHLALRFNKKYYFNDFEICILSGIIIYFWPLIPTGNVFNNWLNILMFLNLPLLIWSRTLRKLDINE